MTISAERINQAIKRALRLRSAERPEIGAYHVDSPSMVRRVKLITQLTRPDDRVLFVGDDDLTSVALANLGYRRLVVVDLDPAVLSAVERGTRGKAETLEVDLRCVYHSGRPAALADDFDLAVTDPPYGPDGLRIFGGVGLGSLRLGGHAIVVYPSVRAPVTGVAEPSGLAQVLQTFMLHNGSVLTDLRGHSQRSYHGTVSHMAVFERIRVDPPIDFSGLDGVQAFY